MKFDNPLTAERMVNNFSLLTEKLIEKNSKFNKYTRATVVSINNETAIVTLLNSSNNIYNVKIRPGLYLKENDEVYINFINNSGSNFFIDTKVTDLIKMFDLEGDSPKTKILETFDDYTDWSNSSSATDGIISKESVWFKFGNSSVKLETPDDVARTLYMEKIVSLDLTQWDDLTTSIDSDYIVFIVYILDVTKINTEISLNLETSSGNHFQYDKPKAELADGYNYIKIKKEDFTETGTGDWSDITLIKIIWDCTSSIETNYVSCTCIGLAEQVFFTLNDNNFAWKDILQSLIAERVESPSSDIIQNSAEGSLTFKNTCTLADYVTMNIQLNHDWAETPLRPHIHWWQTSSTIPNWLIQYRWQVNGQAKTTSWTNVKWSNNSFSYISGTLDQITNFPEISVPVTYNISDIVQFRLVRDRTNLSGLFLGTETAGSIDTMNFDIHYQVNSLGSRLEYVK